ncbi:hypothetical protein ACTORR_25865 [Pseudomonas sp. SAR267]|uniref:hypothetical protein n=1 Tax=Pseudomonas sp. SAR267 TaxID=3454502 RepID=UPI003F937F4C
MKTHFAPFTDLEDLEQAPCGTWLGESSELSGDWAMVDCRLCQKRKERIIAAAADEERFIVEQMGDMAAFMRVEDSPAKEHICTPTL